MYCRLRWTKEPAAGGGPARLSFLGCPLGGAWNEIRDQPECSVAMLVCSWNACNWWSREHRYPPCKCHLLPLVPPSWLLWEGGCVWLIRLPAVFLPAPSGVSVLSYRLIRQATAGDQKYILTGVMMRLFGGKLQREMIFLLATVFTGEINQSLTLVDIRILDTDKEDNKIQMWRCVFYTEDHFLKK